MRLNNRLFSAADQWRLKNYALPDYDREAMIESTKKSPIWIHFGAGNIFRAFQANAVQKLLNDGVMDRGLIAAEGYDDEIIDACYHPQDDLHILVTLKANGTVEKTVVGSIAEAIAMGKNEAGFARVKEIFSDPSLQMATFTITEKGYSLTNGKGELFPEVEADLKSIPNGMPKSYIGKIAYLLYIRYQCGRLPIAMVSMDNCSHNGDKLKAAVLLFAEAWQDEGFLAYVKDSEKVSFPWTMIDKITPRPDVGIQELLCQDGLESMEPVITGKNTYIAPYVNAEECEYLVIEDSFPNGRPKLENAGFLFTDRETVDKVEKMKVCTCLNPLHTAMAIFGCLLGYTKISDEMSDPDIIALIRTIGYVEGLPVVVHPGILDPREFIDAVVQQRLPNPFMPDTPQRIATDTSQKLSIRFGETVKAYLKHAELDVHSLKAIPLVFAGWLRYLIGVDDDGKTFTCSSDPRLQEMREKLCGMKLGCDDVSALAAPVLHDASIWGVDLYEAGLAESVIDDLNHMLTGPGAVQRTLHRKIASCTVPSSSESGLNKNGKSHDVR